MRLREIVSVKRLTEQFLPNPQHNNRADYAENEVRQVSTSNQLYVKECAYEWPRVTTCYSDYNIHATPFSLTTHDTVCDITNKQSCQYRPCCEKSKFVKHSKHKIWWVLMSHHRWFIRIVLRYIPLPYYVSWARYKTYYLCQEITADECAGCYSGDCEGDM